MVDDLLIARNPEDDSSLPFLLRLPLGPLGVVLKVRETWPRTSKVYCHPADGWPDDPDVVERVGVRSCQRRGAAIDLVLARARENRSQFVFTRARGREMIFWQSARTAKQARPNVAVPTMRSAAGRFQILVDSHEQYAWRFAQQQADVVRRALRAGDYGVEVDGTLVATVERKSLADFVSTLTTGKLRYLLADLASVPRAALVVEDRYSAVFKLDRVRPAVVADGLAEAQVRFPTVPIVFTETRQLAQEWTYRFLGAALAHLHEQEGGAVRRDALVPAGPVTAPAATTAEVRAWAQSQGIEVPDRGRLRAEVWEAFRGASESTPDEPARGEADA